MVGVVDTVRRQPMVKSFDSVADRRDYVVEGNQIIFLWQRKVILQEFSFRLFWALFVWLVVNIVR